jgi:hypothetical protein
VSDDIESVVRGFAARTNQHGLSPVWACRHWELAVAVFDECGGDVNATYAVVDLIGLLIDRVEDQAADIVSLQAEVARLSRECEHRSEDVMRRLAGEWLKTAKPEEGGDE